MFREEEVSSNYLTLRAAVDAGLDAVARVRRAERAADGGVLSVPHGLDVAKGTANAGATR